MKVEPLGIIASILSLISLFFSGIFGNLILIAGAIFLSLSYKKYKKDSTYDVKWPLYLAATIVIVTIIIKFVLIMLFPFF